MLLVIRYINENYNPDYVILMDGDGEDRPIEIKSLITKIIEKPKKFSSSKKELKDLRDLYFRLFTKFIN